MLRWLAVRLKAGIPLVLSLAVLGSSAWAWSGKVVGVTDGDTLTVLKDGQEQVKIRLYGIDAPEGGQDFGAKAKQALSALTFGKVVDVQTMDQDRYGRTVGRVFADGQDVNEALVKSGMAWVYHQYCKEVLTCQSWAGLEQDARAARGGLWADPDPTPPWEWRHGGGSKSKAQGPPAVSKEGATSYHGNVNSHIFHRPGCRFYDCKNCIATFKSREEAIRAGFKPCGVCSP